MLIAIECNECGANSIYRDQTTDLKCKACESDDVKVIENSWSESLPKN